MKLALYPYRRRPGQSFEGCPVVVVPNQSMTLKEILKRFIRREALPVEHEGVYAEGLGDVEKLANADITVQLERAAELKQKATAADAGIAAREKEKKEKEATPAPPPPPPTPPV